VQRNKDYEFIPDLLKKSVLIADSKFVEKQWKQFCESHRYRYFSYIRGHNRLSRFLNRVFHFSDLFYSKHKIASLQNVIRCESHRELLETILSSDQHV